MCLSLCLIKCALYRFLLVSALEFVQASLLRQGWLRVVVLDFKNRRLGVALEVLGARVEVVVHQYFRTVTLRLLRRGLAA